MVVGGEGGGQSFVGDGTTGEQGVFARRIYTTMHTLRIFKKLEYFLKMYL